MIVNIYSYYEKVMQYYTAPIFTRDDPEAFITGLKRSFISLAPDIRGLIVNSDLYHMGTFDDETGHFDCLEHPHLLLNCSTVFGGKKDEPTISSENASKN